MDKNQTNTNKVGTVKKILIWLAFVVFGAFAGFGAGRFAKDFGALTGLKSDHVLIAVLLLPIALFLTIAIHELGHLAGAQLAGFRFRVLTLGPWSMIASPTGIRHRFNLKILGLIGGQQISTAREGRGTDRQFLLYLAGGGVANLVTAFIAAGLLLAIDGPGWVRVLLLLLVAMGAVLGVINLVPFRTSAGIATDGYNIRSILRNKEEATRFRAMFDLVANTYSGVRPREWSSETVATLQENPPTEYERALGPLLAHEYALDRGYLTKARETALAVELLIESVPKALRSYFAVELAYFFGAYERDAEKARRYAAMTNGGGYLLAASSVHRALASAAFAEANYSEALAECDRGLAAAIRGNNECDRLLEPEWIAALKARVLEAQRELLRELLKT